MNDYLISFLGFPVIPKAINPNGLKSAVPTNPLARELDNDSTISSVISSHNSNVPLLISTNSDFFSKISTPTHVLV